MKILDLTLAISDSMRGVEMEDAKRLGTDGWNAKTLHMYSHSGTHMDAPLHFGVSTSGIDEIELEKCIVDAWLVDITPCADKQLITSEALSDIAHRIKPGQGLLIRSDWSYKHNTLEYRDALPRVSEELATWCVARGIVFIGVEPPSVADVNNIEELTKVHQILLKNGIVIVEGLTNLDKINQDMVKVIALPLKVKGGDGAPARVIAILEE